jgi:hypothetical protein
MDYSRGNRGEAPWLHSDPGETMRTLLLILTLSGGAAMAQTQPAPEPSPPMVPVVRPPLGAASRAMRHELYAHEREQRRQEQAEDRAEAQQRRQADERALRRSQR